MVIGAIVVATLVMEVGLRLNDHALERADDVHIYDWNGHEHRVVAKPDSVKDPRPAIIVVGDSFVAGNKCGYEHNLTGHMQTAIERVGVPYKVLNFGSGGTSVFTYLSHVEDFIQEHPRPAAIVLVLYSNDIEIFTDQALCRYSEIIASSGHFPNVKLEREIASCRTGQTKERDLFGLRGGIDQTLYRLSHTYRLLRELIAQVAFTFSDVGRMRYVEPWTDPNSAEFQGLLIALSEIKRLAQIHRIPLVIAFYPNVEDLSGQGEIYEAVGQAVRHLGEQLGLQVYNGYEAFLGNPKADDRMVWSLTDVHPSCDAHDIMADWLVQKLDLAHQP
jgi:hypothetical protein